MGTIEIPDELIKKIEERKKELLADKTMQKKLLEFENKEDAKTYLFKTALFTLYFSVEEREEIINRNQRYEKNIQL